MGSVSSEAGRPYFAKLFASRRLVAWRAPPFRITSTTWNGTLVLEDRAPRWNPGALLGIVLGALAAVLPLWQGPTIGLPPSGQATALFASMCGLLTFVFSIVVLVRFRRVCNRCTVDPRASTITIERHSFFGSDIASGSLDTAALVMTGCTLSFAMSHVADWKGHCCVVVIDGLPMLLATAASKDSIADYPRSLGDILSNATLHDLSDEVLRGWCTR